jgi:ABC-type uncharacterized transport system ATPase subunit
MNFQVSSPVLEVKNLTKSFGGLIAVNHVDFDVCIGEIHSLLGENGAGKTTLAECIFSYYRHDSGTICFKGKELKLSSPRDAIEVGIGMVHQHFMLAPRMSVIENIAVATQAHGIVLDLKYAYEKVRNLCGEYGVELDLDMQVQQLPVGKQQWVEILKTLYVGVELLILDEPTAVLTPQETEKLFTALLKMRSQGLSVVLITHKLQEILGFSDRVTVLRHGRVMGTVDTAKVNREELVNMMVGRQVDFLVSKGLAVPGKPILELCDLHVLAESGHEALKGINLIVKQKQIVGLAGVAGNGQNELFDTILGQRRATCGKVILAGQEITNLSAGNIVAQGVASIPPDRIKQGLLMEFSIKENLILGYQNRKRFRTGITLDYKKVEGFTKQAIQDYQIEVSSREQSVKTLSGGNLQRVILARELSNDPQFLIAYSPTRGLDVAATRYVHERLVELRDSGLAVFLISEDLDEILNVSDRIVIIYRGKIAGEFNAAEANREKIGLLMAGF